MVIAIVVVVVVAAVLLIAGAVFWLMRLIRQKETADLNSYLQAKDCQWEKMGAAAASNAVDQRVFFVNHAPAPQGIEMRVYEYAEPSDGSEGDDEGICLSIIDLSNRNGMILNGFALHLEAMQFGDTLWNDHFLGDSGIMERMIAQKRGAWDQMQQDIIVGRYSLFGYSTTDDGP